MMEREAAFQEIQRERVMIEDTFNTQVKPQLLVYTCVLIFSFFLVQFILLCQWFFLSFNFGTAGTFPGVLVKEQN